jgi:predicted ATP-dependent protease
MPYTPQDLSNAILAVTEDAANRVGPDSIGAQQYYQEGQPQKFETMALEELITYAEEEALDLINYSVFLTLRLRDLKKVEARIRAEMSARMIEDPAQ